MESRKSRRNIAYEKDGSKSKNKWKLIFLLSLILLVFVYNQVYILYKYTTGQSVTEKQIAIYKWVTSLASDEVEVEQDTINIAVLGNILLSDKLQNNYIQREDLDISNISKHISLTDYEFTIANLDMAITEDTEHYISNGLFNEFNRLGIDLLNIATENIAYSQESHTKETISRIKENGISYIGANTTNNWYILEKNNIKIAILSYIGAEHASSTGLNVYSSKQLDKDLKKIKEQNVDGTILFVDTLRSNAQEIDEDKKQVLKEILEKDIAVIISNDTVVQEIYSKKDSENNKKYIVYSLGDLVGEQKQENSDVSKLLKISVNKKKENGKIKMTFEASFDKTFVALSNSDVTKCKVVDLEKEISEYNEQEAGNITTAEYYYLLNIQENMK